MVKNNFLKGVKGVILDIDNTLLATNEFVLRNINKTIARLHFAGYDIVTPSEEEIKSVQAKNPPFEDIFKMLFVGTIEDKAAWEVVLQDYRDHVKEENYVATPGALELVNWFNREKIKIGLVTNRVKMVEERLRQAGFSVDQFFFICQPQSPDLAKPHPKSLDLALEKFRAVGITPEELVSFGDHPDDYYSAFYNRVEFVAVLQGLVSREEFKNIGLLDLQIVKDLGSGLDALQGLEKIKLYKNSLSQPAALTGRHALIGNKLTNYFSEYALHKYRIKAEIEHLIVLSEFSDGKIVRLMTLEEKKTLRAFYENFSLNDAWEVLQYDHLGRNDTGPTEHDVKSCELWLKEKIANQFGDLIPSLHLFLTSEDINNLAYKMMLTGAVNEEFAPQVVKICEKLRMLADKYESSALLGRTHLQPASPTTFGKVFAGYLSRFTRALISLSEARLFGKVNGAVGNYNAFQVAYPEYNWFNYSKLLTANLGLETELWSDQRGPVWDMIKVFGIIQEIGNVARDLAQDISLYAGFGLVDLIKIDSHVGSSVMPHKVNPWFAEVAEGNIKKANYLFNVFANELNVSRLQRDLSDHDLERSYGEAIGYVLVALDHLQVALNLLKPNEENAKKELLSHPEVLSEAIQTIMRVNGVPEAYEKVKMVFRGQKVGWNEMPEIISGLGLPFVVEEKIINILLPEQYFGLARELTKEAIQFYDRFKMNLIKKYLVKD